MILQENKIQFVWKHSQLVKSIIEGDVVLINGCEMVNPALLEKLNTLLEEGFLVINECFTE